MRMEKVKTTALAAITALLVLPGMIFGGKANQERNPATQHAAASVETGDYVPGSPASRPSGDDAHAETKIRGKITKIEERLLAAASRSVSDPNASVSDSDVPDGTAAKKQKQVQFHVEADADSGSIADQAIVRIRAETEIYRKVDNKLVAATAQELQEGSEVEVFFHGPLPEMYPIQGNAGKIIILK